MIPLDHCPCTNGGQGLIEQHAGLARSRRHGHASGVPHARDQSTLFELFVCGGTVGYSQHPEELGMDVSFQPARG